MTGDEVQGAPAYEDGRASFLAGLRPQDATALPLTRVLTVLERRFGSAVGIALSPEAVDLERDPTALPPEVQSPLSAHSDSSWMRRTNMVGINVRTVGDYAGVIKYALTLPAAHDAIHLLPIWEPGVVESLYGIAGWNLNTEFFSREMYELHPHLDSIERQLRATTNVLHVMGKAVGMDVIPHTDRYAEPAVANPDLFEWMQVVDRTIVDHSDAVTRRVEAAIFEWVTANGSATPSQPVPSDATTLFTIAEDERLSLMFGDRRDRLGRIARRISLIKHLKALGYEPVPATMGVPFRGIEVDPDPSHTVSDAYGMEWHDYLISEPETMSRVFSPLARFKLYERLDDNVAWEIDFDRPRLHVWDYIKRHYAATQHIGNFDFMRGDMSHVQMRPAGVPDTVDEFYDVLAAVKLHLQRERPWFSYFAESFLPPRDTFQFGEELDHLDASLADATLGDLQSTVVGSTEFLLRFRRYLDDLTTRACAPAFAVMTADKDDPRFDEFYVAGNEARLFTALFVPDLPSYTALGFEIRDMHLEPVANERYTKLFVFREHGPSNVYPSKARFGNEFVWGTNDELFASVTRLRLLADSIVPEIHETTTRWLIPPDATASRGTAAWTQKGNERYVFVANYDLEAPSGYFGIPALDPGIVLVHQFSTRSETPGMASRDGRLFHNGFFHRIENLAPGECRVYRVQRTA